MQVTAVIVAAALSLATGAAAWTKDGKGVWVANNNWYVIRGTNVHEACTVMNSDSTIYRNGESCAYWVDGAGTIFHGHCHLDGRGADCI